MRSTEAFFKDETGQALTTNFVTISWDFSSTKLFIANDHATNYIEYSIDGTNVHGRLKAGEKREMDGRLLTRLALRGQVGGEQYRLEVY